MNSKQFYEEKKKELLDILENENLNASQKLEKTNFLELFTNLEIYQTELSAQNQELLDKEEQLINLKDEFEELYNFAPIAYLQLDDNFHIIKYNKIAFDLLAKNKTSLKMSTRLNLHIHKAGMTEYINFVSQTKQLGKNSGILQFRNEAEIMYGKVSMHRIEKNNKLHYLLSIIDVTKEIKQDAIILNQAKNAAMGEMLSMITHQWKQPLSVLLSISSGMEAILDIEKFDKEMFINYLKNIEDQVEYMNDTVEDFKNFFSESKEQEKINIQECINRAVKFTAPALKKYDIKFNITYEDNKDYTILAYKHDVCQILMNIINNAKDQLKKKDVTRKIEMDIYSQDNDVVFAIKNNGGTIPNEIIDNIFNHRFTTKSIETGSGLGLYISKKIADEHLGAILNVENIQSEDSVVFYLKIPLIQEKE
jgi:signal transduction histidine kinase